MTRKGSYLVFFSPTHSLTHSHSLAVCRWVEEFVGNPNHGHVALIDLIKDLADHPTSTPRKNTKKYAVLDREPVSFNIH